MICHWFLHRFHFFQTSLSEYDLDGLTFDIFLSLVKWSIFILTSFSTNKEESYNGSSLKTSRSWYWVINERGKLGNWEIPFITLTCIAKVCAKHDVKRIKNNINKIAINAMNISVLKSCHPPLTDCFFYQSSIPSVTPYSNWLFQLMHTWMHWYVILICDKYLFLSSVQGEKDVMPMPHW